MRKAPSRASLGIVIQSHHLQVTVIYYRDTLSRGGGGGSRNPIFYVGYERYSGIT